MSRRAGSRRSVLLRAKSVVDAEFSLLHALEVRLAKVIEVVVRHVEAEGAAIVVERVKAPEVVHVAGKVELVSRVVDHAARAVLAAFSARSTMTLAALTASEAAA